MRIALAQLNVVVGDLDGNVERIEAAIGEATRASADLVVLPELAVTGYPPEDLLLRPGFIRAAREAVDEVARACTDVGRARRRARRSTVTWRTRPSSAPRERCRASTASSSCRTTASSTSTGTSPRAGSSSCSSWETRSSVPRSARTSGSRGRRRPTSRSPGRRCSSTSRPRRSTSARPRTARRCSSPGRATTRSYVAFCNLVGGQDELVFDGHSVVLDDEGEVIARAPGFEEALLVVDVDPTEAIGRRLRDVRRRELERSRPSRPAATTIRLAAPRGRRAGRSAGSRRSHRSSSRCVSGSVSASGTTSQKNGFGES